MYPLIGDWVISALGLMHMPCPALHLDPNLPYQLDISTSAICTNAAIGLTQRGQSI